MNILMYHFVSSSLDSKLFKGMNGFKIEEFESHLKYLLKKFTPIKEKDIKTAAMNNIYPNDNYFYLTFDDGFKQHFNNVYPVLKDYNIQASFFIPSMPIEIGKIPIVEKQRVLQYVMFPDYYEFLDLFCELTREICKLKNNNIFYPSVENIQESSNYLKEYTFYSNEERYFRKLRNEYLTIEQFKKVMDKMLLKFFPSEDDFIKDYYLSSWDIKKMSDNGMVIGGHTFSHPFMNKISLQQINEEVDKNINFLSKVIHKRINSFAYPYGAFNTDVIKSMNQFKFDYAFDTRTRGINTRYNIRRNDAAIFFNKN